MTLFDGILLLLAMAGMTIILVHGMILDKIKLRQLWERNSFLKEVMHCSMCTGTWVGATYGILCYYLRNTDWFYLLTLPFAASSFSFFMERLCVLFDDYIIKLNKN